MDQNGKLVIVKKKSFFLAFLTKFGTINISNNESIKQGTNYHPFAFIVCKTLNIVVLKSLMM